ncbi:FecCD family ABC transporter permease [Candidatus Viridilinea mediisalina]|uniref:Iron ABC transporter n=1 Tax=Candidatus Viridilinea mediisalina TaxID=2024553 RepID=A0A2A6REB7_9CHLR|nr:iron ABC transporter permease [Candidatus Viridilinea mediisalina]PDW00782.1 iron ABC transporter [Candidatus Viridilinea mediisalina]
MDQAASLTPETTATPWPRLGLRPLALVAMLAVLLGAFVLSLAVGSVQIPLDQVLTILVGGEPTRATWTRIVYDFRLPKALTAMLAGGALAMSGLQMQTLFRNPLADPFVLGVNSGASLGVALVVLSVGAANTTLLAVAGLLGNLSLVVAACIGATTVMLIVLALAQRVQSSVTLLILGLMIGYLTSALVSLLLYFSIAERIHAYIAWTFGSFGGVTWSQLRVMAPTIILAMLLALMLTKTLNALLLGEAYARSMGLDVRRARLGIVISSAVLAGTVTAFCGPIAFLGIAIPHLCRALLRTADHRILLPACALVGATAALLADLAAQAPGSSAVLPLNAITALLGAPVVVWIILRRGFSHV